MILAKRPRSDAEEVLEWMELDFQPFSGSLVANTPHTGFPSSESLYLMFPSTLGLGSSSQGCKMAEMHLKSSILNYPQKSEVRATNCHQRPQLSSRENINNVLDSGMVWVVKKPKQDEMITHPNTDLNQHQHCFTSMIWWELEHPFFKENLADYKNLHKQPYLLVSAVGQ